MLPILCDYFIQIIIGFKFRVLKWLKAQKPPLIYLIQETLIMLLSIIFLRPSKMDIIVYVAICLIKYEYRILWAGLRVLT